MQHSFLYYILYMALLAEKGIVSFDQRKLCSKKLRGKTLNDTKPCGYVRLELGKHLQASTCGLNIVANLTP
jgi:hypothetical protein